MSLEIRIVEVVQAIALDIKTLYSSSLSSGKLVEINPVLTYTNNVLTRIDYDSTNYKVFIYNAGFLIQVDYVVGSVTTRKTLSYNLNGSLASVVQTTL
jgi:hypothetical protein